MNQLNATAICGNDISSSCLYVSALAIIYAGQYAWISLLVVAAVLYLFRKVYGEVVGAIPLNGGAYNALLNTTKKSTASVAATLTVLSYMATAVISASEAVKYAHVFGDFSILHVTIYLLFAFMMLVILGIGESAKVATAIFLFHIASLILLCGFSIYFFFTNGFDTLFANFKLPVEGGIMTALFFGFCAAMLGISGFESSANYVEEQKPGVFPKTLRNMWILVTVFNPLLAFLALAIIPMGTIVNNEETLLSFMGSVSGGNWLSTVISIDAALVLSGAVLTSYVGVTGLVERMALDRILPKFLVKKNKRGSSYFIPAIFFGLCVSILILTNADLPSLAGVYTIAFLSVMILFGVGNFLLKTKRSRLPRKVRVGWIALFIAILGVGSALVGNIILNPAYLSIFLEYLLPALFIVGLMLFRIQILKAVLILIRYLTSNKSSFLDGFDQKVKKLITRINSQQFVFFTNNDNVATLNKVLQYIERNENTKNLKIVTVLKDSQHIAENLKQDVEVLNRAYPEIRIEFVEERGEFGAEKIEELSKKWNIPINYMFIGSPGQNSSFTLEELGEVRLII